MSRKDDKPRELHFWRLPDGNVLLAIQNPVRVKRKDGTVLYFCIPQAADIPNIAANLLAMAGYGGKHEPQG